MLLNTKNLIFVRFVKFFNDSDQRVKAFIWEEYSERHAS